MKKFLKNQINDFLICVEYLTILPISLKLKYQKNSLERTVKYMSHIGFLLGLISAGLFFVLNTIFPLELAVLVSMILTILITGAMHEDGLADFFDGLGGWYDRKKFLEIMKDSRIGMYGTLAILSVVLLKFFSLTQLEPSLILIAFVTAHTWARFFMISYFYTHEYVRANSESNYKPQITGKLGKLDIMTASIPALVVAGLLAVWQWQFLFTFIPIIIAVFLFGQLLKKLLGGFTGDCFGAIEQILETLVYLSFVVISINLI